MSEMAPAQNDTMTVDAEVSMPMATAQLVRFHMTAPADNIMHKQETYWLAIGQTPRQFRQRMVRRSRPV